MMEPSARLAHKITWNSSKHSYLTAVLLADRDLVDDCLRAYAYFRWVDDRVDDVNAGDVLEREAFIKRQQELISDFYSGKKPECLSPEEEMLADLVRHDRGTHSGLRSFINNFMTVIAFDGRRQGRRVSQAGLSAYTDCLALAVIDGLQYFINNAHSYPRTSDRTLAVVGAHVTHMLRDLRSDLPAGIINVPLEWRAGEEEWDLEGSEFTAWVKGQVEKARAHFSAGRKYIDSLSVWRCKLAGLWYCQQFEDILHTIEQDGYQLRSSYKGSGSKLQLLRMARTACQVMAEATVRACVPGVPSVAFPWQWNRRMVGRRITVIRRDSASTV
jgi:phytoene/squalene synthetase